MDVLGRWFNSEVANNHVLDPVNAAINFESKQIDHQKKNYSVYFMASGETDSKFSD